MAKILTSEDKLLKLNFEGECLGTLQRYTRMRNNGDKDQVQRDLKRIYGLTLKDKSGKWSYIREKTNFNENTQLSEKNE